MDNVNHVLTCDRCGCEIAGDDDGQQNADCVICGQCCRELVRRTRAVRKVQIMREAQAEIERHHAPVIGGEGG